MIKNIFTRISTEYKSYSSPEKGFIYMMMLISFFITAEAAITRATSNSAFISMYGVGYFPIVWLVSVPINSLIVTFYNRYLPRIGCVTMMFISLLLAIIVNTISAFYLKEVIQLPFILYLWKDIFIILMFQQIWSVIHATVNVKRAKYLYGLLFGMGGLGSIAGSLVPTKLAMILGSDRLLLTTLIPYCIVGVCFFFAMAERKKIKGAEAINFKKEEAVGISGGLQLIRTSPLLQLILVLIICMQMSATMLDFQFNSYLQSTIVNMDQRTAFLGKFFGYVNLINVFLQFLGTFGLVRWLGLKKAHLFVPFVLILNLTGFILFPSFIAMSLCFGAVKALDYSIFGIIKEQLYIPLDVNEKFKAKAIIDVFAYRSSKALASLFILGLSSIFTRRLDYYMSWGVLAITIVWALSIALLFKHYTLRVSKKRELEQKV